jgi:exosortase
MTIQILSVTGAMGSLNKMGMALLTLTTCFALNYDRHKMKRQNLKSFLLILLSIIAIWMAFSPLRDLLQNSGQTDYYSHIPLIPLISAFFIFRKRKEIFGRSSGFCFPGLFIMAAGGSLHLVGRSLQVNSNDYASIATFSAIVFWLGSFLFLYGKDALKKAYFPAAFLIFAVPLPSVVMGKIISALVTASASVTNLLFKAIGVHFTREGSIFRLPGFSLEVAKECSGIRSSLALFITSILAGHLFLRKFWKKGVLALAVFPVAVLKNGLRIVGIYLLSYYIDMRFIEGDFHHKFAGSVFFAVGLVLLGLILWFLRRSEGR